MVRFYFDEHMGRAVKDGLAKRGYEVVMATDAGMRGKDDDSEHLVYATENNMVLVTFDHPFAGRTMSRSARAGLICLSESVRKDIGEIIRVLADFADNHTAQDVVGQVFWLR